MDIAYDLMAASLWLLANAALTILSFTCAKILFPKARAHELVMHSLVLGLSCVVGVGTVLGAIGMLRAYLFLLAVPLAQLLLLRGLRLYKSHFSDGARERTCRAQRIQEQITAHRTRHQIAWPTAMWTALFGCAMAHVILHGLLSFPYDYDCLMYHIPMVDHWLQAEGINHADTATWWLPGNNELVELWIVGPFTGDFLVALNNVPILALWAASLLQLGGLVGLPRRAANLAAFAAICVQPTLYELDNAANDMAVAAYWTAAICYLLRHLRTRRAPDLYLFGVAVGALAGVKYYAVGYATALACVATLVLLRRCGWRDAVKGAVLTAALGCLFGGYWYVRNLVLSGSPIYPMDFAGPRDELGYPDVWATTLLGNAHHDLLPVVWQSLCNMLGPFHVFCILCTPLVLVLLFSQAVARHCGRASTGRTDRALVLFLALLAAAALLLITPFCVETEPGTLNQLRWGHALARYGLCFWGTSAIAAVSVLFAWLAPCSRVGSGRLRGLSVSRVATAALLGICTWQVWSRLRMNWDWGLFYYGIVEGSVVAIDVVLVVFLTGAIVVSFRSRDLAFGTGAAAILCAGAATGISGLSARWHDGYASHFDKMFGTDVFSVLERCVPDRATICVLDERPYAFYGSRRQFRVCSPRILRSSDALFSFLGRNRVTVIATRRRDGNVFDLYADSPRYVDAFPGIFPRLAGGIGFDARRFAWSSPEP